MWKLLLLAAFVVGTFVMYGDEEDTITYRLYFPALVVWFGVYCYIVSREAKRQERQRAPRQ